MTEYTLNNVQREVAAEMRRDLSTLSVDELNKITVIGLCEEAGEVAGLCKREIRDDDLRHDAERCSADHFIDELGDVLWYLAAVCQSRGISLNDVWMFNRDKLKERYNGRN